MESNANNLIELIELCDIARGVNKKSFQSRNLPDENLTREEREKKYYSMSVYLETLCQQRSLIEEYREETKENSSFDTVYKEITSEEDKINRFISERLARAAEELFDF